MFNCQTRFCKRNIFKLFLSLVFDTICRIGSLQKCDLLIIWSSIFIFYIVSISVSLSILYIYINIVDIENTRTSSFVDFGEYSEYQKVQPCRNTKLDSIIRQRHPFHEKTWRPVSLRMLRPRRFLILPPLLGCLYISRL